MNIFLRILIGLAITAGGGFIVARTHAVADMFGPIEWAERKLGGGGTYLMYKVIGLIFCFIGIIVATDLWDAFLQATLGSLIPAGV
ncbi:MAG: hypothetical protein KIH65_002735 [Candidatus Uhrbacteria bacterium]|nr:hypothetical protein [Candidatus Uhrbacteria bacterium]